MDWLKAVREKPSVVIFYRGGWSPYCNLPLGELQKIENEIINLGYQIIAVSTDKPEKLRESIKKHKIQYLLLSDSKMVGAKSFGIAFKVDDNTVKKYKKYGLDIEKASGETHYLLPVPSVFIFEINGIINFEYINPDYKIRLDSHVLLAAVKAGLK